MLPSATTDGTSPLSALPQFTASLRKKIVEKRAPSTRRQYRPLRSVHLITILLIMLSFRGGYLVSCFESPTFRYYQTMVSDGHRSHIRRHRNHIRRHRTSIFSSVSPSSSPLYSRCYPSLSVPANKPSLSPQPPPPLSPHFTLALPEGLCVVVRSSPSHSRVHHFVSSVHPDEYAVAVNAIPTNQKSSSNDDAELPEPTGQERNALSFLLGRTAMRHGIRQISRESLVVVPPILRDGHGRPALPSGYVGSISHKQTLAAALVDLDDDNFWKRDRVRGIGVDIERVMSKSGSALGRRVLTERERGALGNIPGVTELEEVLLRFR
uniref:4'-phosphopantetheinyl transferase N-terminal domain-containing protein n=1 Tax=Corethron hystrix TaxID=216773 RepID=A0A7S1BBU9_9STRA|mmetsp:Transcript_20282/g.46011  ORF Transcript_20282/g.46011 Transcript_20282/m.46011 type:complete len:323 (+) Transcript_20282:209-1177(+)